MHSWTIWLENSNIFLQEWIALCDSHPSYSGRIDSIFMPKVQLLETLPNMKVLMDILKIGSYIPLGFVFQTF